MKTKLEKEIEIGQQAMSKGGGDPYKHIANQVIKKNLIKQDIQIAELKKQIAQKKQKNAELQKASLAQKKLNSQSVDGLNEIKNAKQAVVNLELANEKLDK